MGADGDLSLGDSFDLEAVIMPDPADTPEEFERETYRIWDWDAKGEIVHLEATVDVFYLPVGHPENKKPYPRPEFANGTGKSGDRKESTSRVEKAIGKPSRWYFRRRHF